jgi:hypothetical protein
VAWIALAIACTLAALFCWAALTVGGRTDDDAERDYYRRLAERQPDPITPRPGGLYTPVRYYHLPPDDRHQRIPRSPLLHWGINRMTPPLLWVCAPEVTLDALARALDLERVPDPYPDPTDLW